jgi:hypothetical protein
LKIQPFRRRIKQESSHSVTAKSYLSPVLKKVVWGQLFVKNMSVRCKEQFSASVYRPVALQKILTPAVSYLTLGIKQMTIEGRAINARVVISEPERLQRATYELNDMTF